jgi:hypothetical protein
MSDINLKFMENLTTCNSLDVILFTLGVSIFIMGGSYTGYYAGKIISSFFKSNISSESVIQSIKIDMTDLSKWAKLADYNCNFDPILKKLDKFLISPDLLTSDGLIELEELSQVVHNYHKVVKEYFEIYLFKKEKGYYYQNEKSVIISNTSNSFKEASYKVDRINCLSNITNSSDIKTEINFDLNNPIESIHLENDYSQFLNTITDVFFIILNSSMFHTMCICFFFTIHFIILTNKILIFYPSAFYSFIKFKKYLKK